MSTSLGMPAIPPPTSAPAWKSAWDAALYGPDGFFRRESPAAHFRTSVHASPLFAGALARATREAGLDTVVDVGAGRGELLEQLHRIDPGLLLLGVEVAARPAGLDPAIDWTAALPERVDGLIVANEWLDNIPCHVAEADAAGVPRIVHVDPATGQESPGAALTSSSVPESLGRWCDAWWPLTGPGARAEIGSSRDRAWAEVAGRLDRGIMIAVDYGHTREDRPVTGSLRSYRRGSATGVLPDGSRDITAHVAVDAVAATVGGTLLRQADALRRLGVEGSRPPLELAGEDPEQYVAALAQAGEAAEITARGGLGDFFWVVSTTGLDLPPWARG